MCSDLRPVALLVVALLSVDARAGEGTRPGVARLPCPQDAPEGVRLPDRPDCAARVVSEAREGDGFRDIGGVRLRVGGRTSLAIGAGR